MSFASWDAVKRFAGEDYEEAYSPSKAREVLAEFDELRNTTTSKNA
jgi:hypothetical protein